jgi:uncharacterized repeat protein (TIGR03803 family)
MKGIAPDCWSRERVATSIGLPSNGCRHGCGSVFKITPSGTFTTIHNLAFGEGAVPGPLPPRI